MSPKLVLAAFGLGALVVVSRRRKTPTRTTRKKGPDSITWSSAVGPAYCKTGELGAAGLAELTKAIRSSLSALGYAPGDYGTLADAKIRAFGAAVAALRKVCPRMPLPSDSFQLPGYVARYGASWETLYDNAYGVAWRIVTQT